MCFESGNFNQKAVFGISYFIHQDDYQNERGGSASCLKVGQDIKLIMYLPG